MLGEEKYFMAYNLFDLNIRGKICRLCPCHFTERLENFPQFSFTPPDDSSLLTDLSAFILSWPTILSD